MLIAVNASRIGKGKIIRDDRPKEEVDREYAQFNRMFENRNISPEELMRLVVNQYAFTTQHHSWRHSNNFIAGQHLALDMDDVGMSLEQTAGVPFFQRYASFAYTTPSHTEENPRLRIVFALDKPIRDKVKYAELAKALVSRFGLTDQSVKDPARFLYGGGFGCMTHWWGNTLSLQDAATELVFPQRRIDEQHRLEAEAAAANRIVIPGGRVSEARLRAHSGKLLERVRTAAKGEKHLTRRAVAFTFGGYIAGGYYGEAEVLAWLEAAVHANSDNPAAAMDTIRSGIKAGMQKPLHFTEDIAPSPYPELHRVTPPLTPEQIEVISRIIGDREWKAYHDGMTEAQRQVWGNLGIPEYAVDTLNLGVRRDVDPSTGEITEVLTVPFMDGDDAVNVEFRGREVSYASPQPKLFLPEQPTKDSPVLVFSNSLKAIKAWLSFGHAFNVAGLPQATLSDINTDRPTVLVLEPGFNPLDYGLKNLRGTATSITLPFPVEKMIELGMDVPTLDSFVRSRRVFA